MQENEQEGAVKTKTKRTRKVRRTRKTRRVKRTRRAMTTASSQATAMTRKHQLQQRRQLFSYFAAEECSIEMYLAVSARYRKHNMRHTKLEGTNRIPLRHQTHDEVCTACKTATNLQAISRHLRHLGLDGNSRTVYKISMYEGKSW